jgi:hypothetical protein
MQCIDVTETRDDKGYGMVSLTVGRGAKYNLSSHRVAFEQAWGIALGTGQGQVVRHTCDRPSCINPMHLQVGTMRDNVQDRDRRGRNHNARKTHCSNGHEYVEENVRVLSDGERQCKTCNREHARARYQRLTKEEA